MEIKIHGRGEPTDLPEGIAQAMELANCVFDHLPHTEKQMFLRIASVFRKTCGDSYKAPIITVGLDPDNGELTLNAMCSSPKKNKPLMILKMGDFNWAGHGLDLVLRGSGAHAANMN